MVGRTRTRERIAAHEAIPVFPAPVDGEMRWARRDGTVGIYVGPLISLGDSIPRPRSHHPLVYRWQRAMWHLAYGYASGFPVADVLAFTVRGFWAIPIPTDHIPDAVVAEVVVFVPDPELTPTVGMTETELVDLCEFLASGAAIDAGIVEPVRPHWLVPLEPEEEDR